MRDFEFPYNDDTTDIYFGPQASEGKESNWIQTVPGKGRNAISTCPRRRISTVLGKRSKHRR